VWGWRGNGPASGKGGGEGEGDDEGTLGEGLLHFARVSMPLAATIRSLNVLRIRGRCEEDIRLTARASFE